MAPGDSIPFTSLSPRRKRQRSPSRSPSSGSDNAEASCRQRRRHDLSVEVCKDFIRSACRRAEVVCKFAHPPSTVMIERGKVIACADSMHNKCFRGRTCRYFHPPPHILESLFKAISVEDTKDLVVRTSFLRFCEEPGFFFSIFRSLTDITAAHNSHISFSLSSDNSLFFFSLSLRLKSQRSPSPSPNDGSDDPEASRIQRRRHNLSVEVCKDFIRSACRRAEIDCKFAHPPSAVTIERGKVIACTDSLRGRCFRGRTCPYFHPPPHFQGSLLKETGMEDIKDPMCQQSPSHKRSYDSDDAEASRRQHQQHDLSVEVCKDFIRRTCGRAEIDCKFAHPPSSVTIKRGKVIACIDSLRGKCFHGRTCPYLHPPPQIKESLLKEISMEGGKDRMDLQDLESSDHGMVPVCQDFLKNACNRRSCQYVHLDSREMGHLQHQGLSLKLPSSTLLENGAIQNATLLYPDVVPVCKDFLKNACNRDYCRYFHLVPQSEVYLQQHGTLVKLPSSPPPPETEQKRLTICRDFVKNACQRDSCKYAHPNSRTKVVDNQVEICRDFCRGLCHRAVCRFYHPRTRSAER